jgi:hypothetical protein
VKPGLKTQTQIIKKTCPTPHHILLPIYIIPRLYYSPSPSDLVPDALPCIYRNIALTSLTRIYNSIHGRVTSYRLSRILAYQVEAANLLGVWASSESESSAKFFFLASAFAFSSSLSFSLPISPATLAITRIDNCASSDIASRRDICDRPCSIGAARLYSSGHPAANGTARYPIDTPVFSSCSSNVAIATRSDPEEVGSIWWQNTAKLSLCEREHWVKRS